MTSNFEDRVRVLNPATGGAATVPRWYFEHPVFGKNLVQVEKGQKSYTPELYTSQTAEEFADTHPDKIIGLPTPEPTLEVED